MIVFDLQCSGKHVFEAWFRSTEDYEGQRARNLVSCPVCGDLQIGKAVMAPAVAPKGNQRPSHPPAVPAATTDTATSLPVSAGGNAMAALPPEAVVMLRAIATMQAEALKSSRWVGESFAESARAMHYGERDAEAIHGRATPDEARALIEEGVEVAPILFPVVPPGTAN